MANMALKNRSSEINDLVDILKDAQQDFISHKKDGVFTKVDDSEVKLNDKELYISTVANYFLKKGFKTNQVVELLGFVRDYKMNQGEDEDRKVKLRYATAVYLWDHVNNQGGKNIIENPVDIKTQREKYKNNPDLSPLLPLMENIWKERGDIKGKYVNDKLYKMMNEMAKILENKGNKEMFAEVINKLTVKGDGKTALIGKDRKEINKLFDAQQLLNDLNKEITKYAEDHKDTKFDMTKRINGRATIFLPQSANTHKFKEILAATICLEKLWVMDYNKFVQTVKALADSNILETLIAVLLLKEIKHVPIHIVEEQGGNYVDNKSVGKMFDLKTKYQLDELKNEIKGWLKKGIETRTV
jgi:hypothetical protein